LQCTFFFKKQLAKKLTGIIISNTVYSYHFTEAEDNKWRKSKVWRCRNCGYLHEGNEASDLCPACADPEAHFELLGENY